MERERECGGQQRFSLACFWRPAEAGKTPSASLQHPPKIHTFARDQLSLCKLQLYILTANNTNVIECPFFFIASCFVIQLWVSLQVFPCMHRCTSICKSVADPTLLDVEAREFFVF